MAGSLDGLTIVELAGIGPAPFAGMMLADHGARVIRVERPGLPRPELRGPLARSREWAVADLKTPEGVASVRALAADADGLIEGFRPGVLERLGLAPATLLADNPRLVVGRVTGWGQDGPLAPAAGHDIDYLALSGTLSLVGRTGSPPTPPANLLGDFGGGGMLLAFAMLAGVLSARATGRGQVIDCAMVDGCALLASMVWGFRAIGLWDGARGENLLDTGAPFYEVYECADGRHVAVGAIEPAFHAALRDTLGLADDALFDAPMDARRWPAMKARLAAIFATRSRDDWVARFEGIDACVAPVLTMAEAPAHPHNAARGTFVEVGGVLQPAPAPRFSATPAPHPRP